jgi:hypothetical protein
MSRAFCVGSSQWRSAPPLAPQPEKSYVNVVKPRARVDERHLLLHIEPRAGDDDAALARAERSGVANEGPGERYAVAGEDHGKLMQHMPS